MTRKLHPLVKEICMEDYKYAKLHESTSALFDINEVWLALGEQTDSEYRPGMVTGPEEGTSAAELLEYVQDGTITLNQLQDSYEVINRYDDMLRHHGYEL